MAALFISSLLQTLADRLHRCRLPGCLCASTSPSRIIALTVSGLAPIFSANSVAVSSDLTQGCSASAVGVDEGAEVSRGSGVNVSVGPGIVARFEVSAGMAVFVASTATGAGVLDGWRTMVGTSVGVGVSEDAMTAIGMAQVNKTISKDRQPTAILPLVPLLRNVFHHQDKKRRTVCIVGLV